jgi:hypothetical protein
VIHIYDLCLTWAEPESTRFPQRAELNLEVTWNRKSANTAVKVKFN